LTFGRNRGSAQRESSPGLTVGTHGFEQTENTFLVVIPVHHSIYGPARVLRIYGLIYHAIDRFKTRVQLSLLFQTIWRSELFFFIYFFFKEETLKYRGAILKGLVIWLLTAWSNKLV
jgi:hypothetical protein